MDDILLILLGIIWAVFSFYQSQQKKKKKAAQQRASSSKSQSRDSYSTEQDASGEEGNGFLDKVFNTLNSEYDDPYESFASEATVEDSDWKEEVETQKIKAEESLKNADANTNDKDTFSRMSSHKRLRKPVSSKNKKMLKEISKDFDGKKAVIYSEILNRRHI